jgi:hypothetical protein
MKDQIHIESSDDDKTGLVRTYVKYKRADESDFTTVGTESELPHYEWFEQIEIIRLNVYKEIAEGMRIDKQITKGFFRETSLKND